jgi:hypothetical protein
MNNYIDEKTRPKYSQIQSQVEMTCTLCFKLQAMLIENIVPTLVGLSCIRGQMVKRNSCI